jgi:5'-nucleotidase
MLRGVDVEISGGGHELLANSREGFPPNTSPVGPYPLYYDAEGKPVLDKDGRNVPVVTAGSAYACLGKLVVEFDEGGNVVKASGEPLPVTAVGKRAIVPDKATEECVVKPVYAFVRDYGTTTVAISDVALDGLREHVRNRGTNLGDLMADALLAEGRRQASAYRMPAPGVAVVNGGGIRCNRILPSGKLTNTNLRSVAPFMNYLTLVDRVSPEEFKALAEHMVGEAGHSGGRFGQIAGFRIVYDAKAPAGSRVRSLVLDDGREIVRDGRIAVNAPDVTFATIDFLANGGDGYPFVRGTAFVTPVLQSEALRRYLAEDLKGHVDAARYPEGGSGRVSAK